MSGVEVSRAFQQRVVPCLTYGRPAGQGNTHCHTHRRGQHMAQETVSPIVPTPTFSRERAQAKETVRPVETLKKCAHPAARASPWRPPSLVGDDTHAGGCTAKGGHERGTESGPVDGLRAARIERIARWRGPQCRWVGSLAHRQVFGHGHGQK